MPEKRKHSRATEKFFLHEKYLSPIWNDTRFEYNLSRRRFAGEQMIRKRIGDFNNGLIYRII